MMQRFNKKYPFTLGLLSLLFMINSAYGQTISKIKEPIGIETRIMYGFVLAHHRYIMHMSQSHFAAFDFSLIKKTYGSKAWHQNYKFPEIGLGYYYSDFGKQTIIGKAHALYPFMIFPLKENKCFSFNFRFGTGLGYLTKTFERFNNYKNVAISSHFNLFIQLTYETKFRINKKLHFTSGVGLTHFSNGSYKTPNLGLNIPSINASLQYNLINNPEKNFHKINSLQKKHEYLCYGTFGLKEIYPQGGKKYPVFSLSFNYNYIKNSKRKFGAGYDLSYNEASVEQIKRDSIIIINNFQMLKHGILIGHELDFGKLAFIFQTGFYIYSKNIRYEKIFSRLALRYPINNKFFINGSIKTHFFKADCFEWGLGYNF